MESKPESYNRKRLIILLLAVVAAIIYLLSIFFAYPVFQNTRLTDPLAEIHALFPFYYVAIGLTALLGVSCFIWRIENKYLRILLLMMLAVMLWFTPYYLAGFVRVPDAPWHIGAAMHIPQLLDGAPLVFADYAQSFPGSFIYHYALINIADIKPTSYMSNSFPLICLLLFVLLCYVLISRIFSERAAFLGMLIAIPGLHYIQLHPSPHTIGVLLMLTALLLLIRRGTATTIVAFGVILVVIVSHPTSPLLLSIFLAAALLASMSYLRRISRAEVVLAGILIACFVGWFAWYSFYPGSRWGGAQELYQGMTPSGFGVAQEYLLGTPFIYRNIYSLNKGVYLFYAAAVILGIVYTVARTYAEKKSIRNCLSRLGGLSQGEIFMALSVPLLLILALLLAENAHDLIETGLTFIMLVLSCIIASIISRSFQYGIRRRIIHSLLIVTALFLTLSFPVIAYSIDAYTSIPESEEAGLEFLASNFSLYGKTLAMSSASQLALYGRFPSQTKLVSFADPEVVDLSRIMPDLIVFRSTNSYYVIMRFDLSFENNRYSEYLAMVNQNKYDKLYSSPTFEVYSKN